ncbi:MAG: ammonium transporter [SAR202 cluster bacterium]|jgi:Amt family ammonium transporter|nr:ammonium transporter [Chloroflexota bacterium]MCH2523220.1 ammonium transporter [Dehalococcoidia bacterium]MQG84298.1 ammonium transporter [SAR202 cluster bacterium]|tara:strand:+ start:651 stop:1910 length:1260 start_codon:yes stop_codon:yes gene_type:complete
MDFNPVSLDIVWILFATVLVFLMQAGFSLLEAGATRAKNSINIIMKNVMDMSLGSLAFWIVGFGLMFGTNSSGWIGTDNFLLSKIDPASETGYNDYAFFIFQTVFAATAATIISGAVAERTKFAAYLIYAVAVTAFIYPIFGSWVWGGGWLNDVGPGFIDFAGSTVVHSVGGWAALAGAIVVGPRIGKYAADKSSVRIPGHSVVLMALGVFVLWFGWFGFNAGSTVSGNDGSIAVIFITTNLAAAAGAVGAMFISYIIWNRFDVFMTLNGVIAGLVAITAGCANMGPGMAMLTGLIGGFVVVGSAVFLENILKVDDPVGAIAAHGFTGAWGTIAVGLFAQKEFGGTDGLFFGGGADLLMAQITGVAAAFIFVFTTSFIVFKVIDLTIGMRVTEEEETIGLDVSEHSASGYPDFTNVTKE